jgi:hypothetical protein
MMLLGVNFEIWEFLCEILNLNQVPWEKMKKDTKWSTMEEHLSMASAWFIVIGHV